MRPVETVPGMLGMIRRMVEGVNSSMIYFIHCKNLCKCHSVAPVQQQLHRKNINFFPNFHYTLNTIHILSQLGGYMEHWSA
jgi:hypothetical protein